MIASYEWREGVEGGGIPLATGDSPQTPASRLRRGPPHHRRLRKRRASTPLEKRLRPQRLLAFILLLCATVFCVSACRGKGKEAKASQEVAVAQVARGSIAQEVLFTGNIVAKDFAEVFPRGNGRVAEKLLNEGDPVKKGQAILTIDRDEVGYRFRPLALDSPIDGYVGTINVDVGAFVYDRNVFNAKPAAVVVLPGPMRVKLDIPERYLDVIRPGIPVTMIVDTLGGAEYAGTIVTQSPVVDEKTRTANVEVEVSNTDGRLRHGMFGRMKLVVERHDGALLVPLNAVSWEGERTIVYRVADGKVHRVEVMPGLRNTTDVEILAGLGEGDEVAVGCLFDLEDGEAVAVTGEAPSL